MTIDLSPYSYLPAIFALVAIVASVVLIQVTPIGETPDEMTHVIRAAALLDGELIGHRALIDHPIDHAPIMMSGYDIDPAWWDAYEARERLPGGALSPRPPGRPKARFGTQPSGFAEASNTASYAPTLYLPSAIGMGVAVHAGASPRGAVLAGRVCNAAFFVIVSSLALWTCRKGRLLTAGILLMPMTLSLASAIGQDGPLIALSALAAAAMSRIGGDEESGCWRAVAVVALAAVLMAKPPYLPLALLAGLRGGRAGSRPAISLVPVVAAAAPCLAWSFWAWQSAAVPFWRVPYSAGPLWHGAQTMFRSTDPEAQVGILLVKPFRLLIFPIRTIRESGGDIIREFVGVLGHLDLSLPPMLHRLWHAALAVSVLQGALGRFGRSFDAVSYASAAASLVFAVLLIYDAQYVTWTNVGEASVAGVQGRYLIPVAILAAGLLPPKPPSLPETGLACVLGLFWAASCVAAANALRLRYG